MSENEPQKIKSKDDDDKGTRWRVATQIAAAFAVVVSAIWASPTIKHRIEDVVRSWFPATLKVEVVQEDLGGLAPEAIRPLRLSVASRSSVIESSVPLSTDSFVDIRISEAGSEKDRVVVVRDKRSSTCSEEFDSTKASPGVVKCVVSLPVLLHLGFSVQSRASFSKSIQAIEGDAMARAHSTATPDKRPRYSSPPTVLRAPSLTKQKYEEGEQLYNAGQYDAALRSLREAASSGSENAMFRLGWMYSQGEGVPQDFSLARQWYDKSASRGVVGAMVNLALLYKDGKGGPQDHNLQRQWLEKAASRGVSTAMFNLGAMYYAGDGVPRDLSLAREWFEKAEAQGLTDARDMLAKLRKSSPQEWQ